MSHPATLALIAIFVWWFSTGAILLAVRWADRQGGAAHGMVVLAGLPFLVLGVAGVIASLAGESVGAVYAGFLGALAIWGWVELAFLTGVIAGPERRACPPGLQGAARFGRAWGTVAHHEIALTLGLLVLVILSSGAANQVALWTYVVLYVARVSAKLNLFFGVPRINTEFVPARIDHIKTYFRRGPVTPAFPVAITILTIALGLTIERLLNAGNPVDQAAYTLLAALSALALLEHWLMVVPLPDAKLWRWMLPAPKSPAAMSSEERPAP
jgi:putative photosynthetic complex assembly protein 2